jgi:hypothetical protein
MNLVMRTINDARIATAARNHARLGLEPAHDRELEALLGPPMVVAEDDLEQRRHQGRLMRSREAIDENESVVTDGPGEPPNPAKVPPFVYLVIAAVCVVTDYAGSELTAYFAGVPAAQRVFVAASFTVGALLVTSGVAYGIERLWAHGASGRLGAVALGVGYVVALLAVASSRFAPIDEDVSVLEVAGGALMTLFGVGGPAVAAHLALRAWVKSRPAALAARDTARALRRAERDADRAHRALSGSQRAARERESERARLRAAYLNAFRAEAARVALARARPVTPSPEEN